MTAQWTNQILIRPFSFLLLGNWAILRAQTNFFLVSIYSCTHHEPRVYTCVFFTSPAQRNIRPTSAGQQRPAESLVDVKKNSNNNDIIRSSTQRRSRQFQPKISPCGPPSVSKSQIHIRKLRCCCEYNEAKVKSPFDICQYSIIVAIFSAAVVVNPIE
jgi:hypothetical protein